MSNFDTRLLAVTLIIYVCPGAFTYVGLKIPYTLNAALLVGPAMSSL